MIGACPSCGKTFEADTLKALARKIGTCRHSAVFQPPQQVPVELFVPLVPLSHNRFHNTHWTVYNAYKKDCRAALESVDLSVFGRMLPFSRWVYVRCYTGKEKEFDDANFVGGTKPITDTLVRMGVLVDDKPCNFKATYEQRRGDVSGLILRLVEVDAVPRTAY